MKRKAFTLIEMTMALAITALIIGSITALHAYVLKGLGTATAHYSDFRQAQQVLDGMDEVATQAQSYSLVTVNGQSCLKLVMPASCSDTDNDGLPDLCAPSRLNKRGLEEWGQGKRIWFYMGDSSGSPGGETTLRPWAAIVNDDSNPSSSTAVSSFTKYTNGKAKFSNIDTIVWRAGGNDYFTATVTASVNNGELTERKVSVSQDNNLKDSYSVARIYFTSRWRK